ncbi:hypothetical protein BH23THE1_BH23THE1_25190 [soil metagenome]
MKLRITLSLGLWGLVTNLTIIMDCIAEDTRFNNLSDEGKQVPERSFFSNSQEMNMDNE